MKRRALLAGLVAAPAIVTAGNIMRINPKLALPPQGIYTSEWYDYRAGREVLVHNGGPTPFFIGPPDRNLEIYGFRVNPGETIHMPADETIKFVRQFTTG